MRRADLVALPMHRERVLAQYLHAIHPHVPDSRLRIPCNHSAERDVRTAVLWPATRHGNMREVDMRFLDHGILTGRTADRFGREFRDLRELRQHREFAEEAFG